MAAAQGDRSLAAIELDLLDRRGPDHVGVGARGELGEARRGNAGRLGERPRTRVELARRHGHALERAGHPDDARRVLVAELPAARALGPLDEVGLLEQLGLAENDLGSLDDARAHLERARSLARGELGDQHPRVASITHDLATTVYRQGKYAEAEKLLREALAVRELTRGADSTDVANSAEALGVTMLAEDRLAEGRPLLERAIKILRGAARADEQ